MYKTIILGLVISLALAQDCKLKDDSEGSFIPAEYDIRYISEGRSCNIGAIPEEGVCIGMNWAY